MLAAQPLDTRPNLTDPALVLAALNPFSIGGVRDASPNGNAGTLVGRPVFERAGGLSLDGVGDRVDFGDIGNIVEVSMWINPMVGVQQIFLVDGAARVDVIAGTVTYAGGLVEVATYVNGVASTTLAGNQWQHLVCQFEVDDANTFTLGYDTSNYGEISVRDLRARSALSSVDEIARDYNAGVPDDSLRLHLHKHQNDLSRYVGDFDNINGVVLGHGMEFDGATNYLRRAVSDWRSGDEAGTICAWVKLDAIGAHRTIFNTADEAVVTKFLQCQIDSNGKMNILQNNTGVLDSILGDTILIANRWYHVVFISDGSTYIFYLNGQVETLSISSGANNGDWLADTDDRDNVTIGCRVRNDKGRYFNGLIKDVRYYSEPKSADYVKDLYEKTRIYY